MLGCIFDLRVGSVAFRRGVRRRLRDDLASQAPSPKAKGTNMGGALGFRDVEGLKTRQDIHAFFICFPNCKLQLCSPPGVQEKFTRRSTLQAIVQAA